MQLLSKRALSSAKPACPRKYSGGLSLLELLLVMAILSVSAGIGVPVYKDFVEEARIAVATKDIQSISLVLDAMYEMDALPQTLQEIGVTYDDPWGNPYQYRAIATDMGNGNCGSSGGGSSSSGSCVGGYKRGAKNMPIVVGGGGGTSGIDPRTDKTLAPLNSDYDLYSMGGDGLTQTSLLAEVSKDDIVRALDGKFISLGQDY